MRHGGQLLVALCFPSFRVFAGFRTFLHHCCLLLEYEAEAKFGDFRWRADFDLLRLFGSTHETRIF